MLLDTLTLLLLLPISSLAARPKNAILLSEVRSLTLRGNGAKTTNRRVTPVPQLKCISSAPICNIYSIDVMRCTNQGSSYGDEDIEWSCTASLPEELKLGSTDVICEGYASAEDPYVLKGSCAVEYRLALTEKGERKYPSIANPRGLFNDGEGGTDWSAWLFTVVFVAVLAWIIYSACYGDRGTGHQQQPRRRGDGGGGGGGWNPGWGPGNDPPPPYPDPKPYSTQQEGWRPGFWSGLAGGAAAGYAAGSRNRNDGYRRGWDTGPSYPRTYPSSSSSSNSNSNSGTGSARYESTGFGSTRRR